MNDGTAQRLLCVSLEWPPLPGTPLIRRLQGKDIIVHVRQDGGFECNGRIYKSLSRAVPKRAHNPLLIAAGFIHTTTPIPWWDNRPLALRFR